MRYIVLFDFGIFDVVLKGVSDANGFHAYPLQWPIGTTNLSKNMHKGEITFYFCGCTLFYYIQI